MDRLRFLHIYAPVLAFIWLGLFIDSAAMAAQLTGNQWFTDILALAVFGWVYRSAGRPVRKMMLYGVVIALGGEVFFSLILEMYTYRLGNVPLYVPMGHAIIYAGVYYMAREGIVRQHRQRIISLLYPLMVFYSSLWLIFAGDLFGFLCMAVILLIFRRRPESMLFFLLMFFMIAYLELVGTSYGCWQWPSIWFGNFEWMPSANPPSGISVFYFAFDAGCLWFYKHLNRHKWDRMRAIQRQSLVRRAVGTSGN